MESDFENMIMNEEQAHLFAIDIYKEVIEYFKSLEVFKYLEDFVSKAVFSVDGSVIIRDNAYQYKLCNYTRIV